MAKKEGKTKKSRKGKKVLTVILIILVLLVAGLGLAWINLDKLVLENPDDPENILGKDLDSYNILLVGCDSGSYEDHSRSDSIMVANVNWKYGTINGISIPRDSRVEIEGVSHPDKINSAYARGGIELTKSTVENLLGINIDYYAVTDFNGFKGIIDTLGGIEIDVDKRMHYRTYNQMIDLQPGLQTLNGEQALGYVRFRHEALGDISRAARQETFTKAVVNKVLSPSTITKLPTLVPQVMDMVDTNLTKMQIFALAKEFVNMNTDTDIRMTVCPGNFLNINGASYWGIDEVKMQELVNEAFNAIPPQVVEGETALEGTDNVEIQLED